MSFAKLAKALREDVRRNDEAYGFHGNLIWMLENREVIRKGLMLSDPKAHQLMTLYAMFEKVSPDPGVVSSFQDALKEYRKENETEGCS